MKIPIYDWEEKDDPERPDLSILRIPYPADIDVVVEDLKAIPRPPYAVLPPYSDSADASFTARCAAVARDRLTLEGAVRILIAAPRTGPAGTKSFIRTLQQEGFNSFALPPTIGSSTTPNLAGFWNNARLLRGEDWYHIAGRDLSGLSEDCPGRWTWSEEEL